MTTYWYRYYEIRYSESTLMLIKAEYPVEKETPKGVWIQYHGDKKFVLRDARKRFACPTEAEALESFYKRKARQIRILQHRLAEAQAAMLLKKEGDTNHVFLHNLEV